MAHPFFFKLEDTPSFLECFSRFLHMPYPALLDSALVTPSMGEGRLGRFSYFTADPFLVLRSKGRQVEMEARGSTTRRESDPFQVLQDFLGRFSLATLPGLPPFQGGVIGYWAYELGHHLERLPRRAVDDLALPEMNVAFYDWAIAQDHETGSTWAIATGLPEGGEEAAQERLGWIQDILRRGAATPPSAVEPFPPAKDLTSTMSPHDYMEAVKAVKAYLASGDVYQVNVSHRFEATIAGDPFSLYLHLRQVNPAPFGAYLRYPEVAVLSASPEQFLCLEHGIASTRPMKGTRPRGKTLAEDHRLAAELLASEKDRAENLMIVDLLRNDLGKVCVPGSIEVPELFALEEYATVFQMVSTVRGRLLPGLSAVDLLKACFPGGSVTGAPKIRAMEIIDELEPTQRSVYCGAIGYIGFDGSMLAAVPIRILLAKGNRVYFQVGAGIVADSDPLAEYEETLHKARGSLAALGIDA